MTTIQNPVGGPEQRIVAPGRNSDIPSEPVCFLDLRARARAAATSSTGLPADSGAQLAMLWPNGIPKNS